MPTLAAAAAGAELPHAHAEDLARRSEGERVVRPPCARCKVTPIYIWPISNTNTCLSLSQMRKQIKHETYMVGGWLWLATARLIGQAR
jgi:hypothetical protein